MDQCTYRLGLNSAARGIYTEDGTMIMEIEDLIDWAVENYKTLMAEYLQGKEAKGRSCDNTKVGHVITLNTSVICYVDKLYMFLYMLSNT